MREAEPLEVRLLSQSDIPAAFKLKELAGWNQTEDDWRRLLQLEPLGCFAALWNGNMIGTTTTTSYGEELGWIGMVLVNPENRRRGVATRLMKTALDYLSRKVPTVKLDATAEGKAVYECLGFEIESVIERWSGIASASSLEDSARAETVAGLGSNARNELLALDQQAFGVDRSRLIKLLIDDACVAPVITRDKDGRVSGYALARRGTDADYVGPLVSSDHEQFAPLLDRTFAQLRGRQIYVDLSSASKRDKRVLADRGLMKQRDLIRMSYGKRNNSATHAVFAIAGPEVG